MAKEKKDKLIKKFTPERMKEIVLDLSRISNDSNYMAEKKVCINLINISEEVKLT